MSVLFSPRFQAVDANGNPYNGAKLYFYQSGTTTPIDVYQDSGSVTPHASPVVADAAGKFAAIFLTTNPFKFVLKTSAGTTLDSADAVPLNDAAALLTAFQITNSATITTVDPSAAVGPTLELYRNSTSPAASDAIGAIYFTGKDSTGVTTTYASIEGQITDPVDTTEDGTLLLKLMVAGTLTTRVTLNAAGVLIPTLTLTNALAATSGGTGFASYASGDILYASGTTALAKLAKGSDGQVLTLASGLPSWVSSIVSVATQSDQETATSLVTAVTPGRQQYHPSSNKAWANVTVTTGTPAISASYNVGSITDAGVGLITFTMTTAFSSVNWSAVAMVAEVEGSPRITWESTTSTKSTTAVRFACSTTGGSLNDPVKWNFSAQGDQ